MFVLAWIYLFSLITLLSFHFVAIDSRDEDCGCSRFSGIILWRCCGSYLVVSPGTCPDYKALSLVLKIHFWSPSDSFDIFFSLSSLLSSFIISVKSESSGLKSDGGPEGRREISMIWTGGSDRE